VDNDFTCFASISVLSANFVDVVCVGRFVLLKFLSTNYLENKNSFLFYLSGADSQAKMVERNDAGWRDIQVSSKSHDIVRDDSRYTGTSGNSRKSYITHFRDSVDSPREHNAVDLRVSDFAPNTMARSLSAHRSKINDIWTMSEFRSISAPSHFSRTGVLGEIAKIAAIQNSSKVDRPSFHASSGNSKMIRDERIDWTRFNPDLKVGRIDYSKKANTENLERSKSGVTSNENLESLVAQTRHLYSTGNDFLATHASGFEKTNDDISVAVENRRKLNLVRSNLLANEGTGGEMSRQKLEQDVNRFSLQKIRTNVSRDSQADAATRFIHKDRNSIRKITESSVSHGNSMPGVVIDSFRHSGGNQRDDLNNSERSVHGVETALIPNSKSEVVGHSRVFPRRNTIMSHRNFVKLRYPYWTSNRRNASNVALNMKVKNGNDVDSTGIQLRQPSKGHFTRTAAKKPVGLNNHATSKPTKSSHSSFAKESPSQRVSGGNKTRNEYGDTSVQYNAYLKNWPNEALQNIEDLYNYEKYTSLEEESSHESDLSNADETPILNNYFDRTDPILDSSVKQIIHWLKVPTIVSNSTQYFDYNDDKPVLESIYENLEPNRPLNIQDNETILQDIPPNQDFDKVDYHANYPIQWSNPSSIVRPQYVTDSSNPSAVLIPSSWSNVASLRNKTAYNPMTHVTQNTVVHILNDGLKKPNVTVTQLKAPETDTAAVGQATSSGSSSESLELAQRPNVHVMFTSQKDEDKDPSKQKIDFPLSSANSKCPTIMINTYTRVNNTIQSKEGCTDLNIIVNSHVSNTNVFTPSSTPAIVEDQQTSLATQSYGDANKNENTAFTDLSHEDFSNSYVTVSTGTYGSGPLETPQSGQHDYYESQKNPSEIPNQWNGPTQSSGLSTIEVFQGTQISIPGSNVPLADAETTNPAESSVDGPGDDTSNSAVNPPAGASTSGSSVAGSLGSENPSVPQELPVHLIKPGPVKGQANNGLVPGSLQLPSFLNRPSKPGLSSVASPSLSQTSGASGSSDDDDDDDDDDFDMSPGSMLQYIGSTFTASFLNPLSYGFFSLTAAPFVAMAAGVLGVAAVILPWALPNVLDFGRSADKTIGFVPNLEAFVRQAVHKYDRLNEWKSKRRKGRR